MESRPSKTGQSRDRISALPDELLLGILERLRLRDAVRAGAVSTRWWHLPHQLSRLILSRRNFHGTTPHEIMDAFTGATQGLLCVPPLADSKCDCRSTRAVKVLRLNFYVSAPHLSSIGSAVEDTVSRGQTEHLVFDVVPPSSDLRHASGVTKFGQQFMSFSRACPIAFRWLTCLFLSSLKFRAFDLQRLVRACEKLKVLYLTSCRLVKDSVLKIDVPNSVIEKLQFFHFRCKRIDLVSVPKLTQLECFYTAYSKKTPLLLGYVPELRKVELCSHVKGWKAPFALSECFSMNACKLSELYLEFNCRKIWVKPEHPKQLSGIFSNLTRVALWFIFPECDLKWTLFILDAAPALKNFAPLSTRPPPEPSCPISNDLVRSRSIVVLPTRSPAARPLFVLHGCEGGEL
ncbi:hypothetical protein QYE76_060151 [Lolium multiflorum]|uniref:F-box domain-containing protein n=1 Tax=Lolium multiflorum TaxID=4521 RepID=A0AAD8W3I9_LOLMU|nr:hypothetical protein QYE76_060151 [Lolium multiflorum]